MKGSELGEFLRARRAVVRPEDVGLAPGTRRRVPGLRREEVALLADISPEYYLRLEQGRDSHPSGQVLASIAEALRLDSDSRAYLFRIAAEPRRPVGLVESTAEELAHLVTVLNVPAFLMDRYRNVLAANSLAFALDPGLRVGTNRLIALFTDVRARAALVDWERDAADLVAQLRSDAGRSDDPRLRELVSELSAASAFFRDLWARHDVRLGGSGPTTVHHPEVGDITLRREKLTAEPSGHILAMYHPEPGSESAARLDRLFHAGR